MRSTFQVQDNINGIILEGGTAANVIPELAKCEFSLRAETMLRIKELIRFVTSCIEHAEALTGAKAEVSVEPIYAERYPNKPMCQAFKNNMESLGIQMTWAEPGKLYGSSDIEMSPSRSRQSTIICLSQMIKPFKATPKNIQKPLQLLRLMRSA